MLIYYISKELNSAEGPYTLIEIGPSTGDHGQAVAPLFPFIPYMGEDEHALEVNFGKTGYYRTIGEMGCRIESTLGGRIQGRKMATICGRILHNSRQWCKHSHTSTYGEDLEFAVKFGFKASNNKAEYETLVVDTRMAHEARARRLVAYSDSQLIVKYVEGTYEAKEENMIEYLQQIAELKAELESFQLIQIPREENVKADCLR
ncbi:hypothetical protein Sango_1239500 [Sesamum angolense]|uniref:RNase H type-1 domain-containing protein n=1 Tax=Sesamum angolense TaxID=2727404 RepID=A0AAE2BU45_9LAMI|nr:hypothetical protein Sango_1239500 [Sesamum angolense]